MDGWMAGEKDVSRKQQSPIYDRQTIKHTNGSTLISYQCRYMAEIDEESATAAKLGQGVYLVPSRPIASDWRGISQTEKVR